MYTNLGWGLIPLQCKAGPVWKNPVHLTQYSAISANLSNTLAFFLKMSNIKNTEKDPQYFKIGMFLIPIAVIVFQIEKVNNLLIPGKNNFFDMLKYYNPHILLLLYVENFQVFTSNKVMFHF